MFAYMIKIVLSTFEYSRTSMARTGLGPSKIVLAKGSSSHPGWILNKLTVRTVIIVQANSGE